MRHGQFFINGKWVEPRAAFTSASPATGEDFGEVGAANAEEVDLAVQAARHALREWRTIGVAERARIVERIASLIRERSGQLGATSELKSLIVDEVGKPFPEADIEAVESADMLSFFAERGPCVLAQRPLPLNEDLWMTKKSHSSFEPVGVVGVIKAWNYPLEIPLWSIAPALIAGNTLVFKPSEHSAFTGLEIASLFNHVGLPDGVFNVVTGGAATGAALIQSNGVDLVDFTGSVAVGREIAVECGKRLRRYNLELGGNDAAIVDADADMETAANGLVWGAFCNAGQVCVGIKRAFVHEKIAKSLLALIVERTIQMRPAIDFGPVISESQVASIEGFVANATDGGARILCGGRRMSDRRGYWFPPTVLADVSPASRLMQEECFGPLLPIVVVASADEAIRMANDTTYGLGASVWTSDLANGRRIAELLETGMVWINDVNVAFPAAPWGGVKSSGRGIALSDFAFNEYASIKHISVEVSRDSRRAWWYPYSA